MTVGQRLGHIDSLTKKKCVGQSGSLNSLTVVRSCRDSRTFGQLDIPVCSWLRSLHSAPGVSCLQPPGLR